ncbi:hypothetical protein H2O64_15035 [Kordia sp. YSTF-M3]|uniref:Double-GTPase 2 domain-containing protein n=1 Tax=Kordia aestuariivivens TaxID=2759037 RepID=A0ABR7QC98_9FLAO|nr:hypothetical protein [Kordia aestuariivivens]MBC8755991.1 hypothetical protein [Kordia aestuariivivens]
MSYKCPRCLHTFQKREANVEIINTTNYYSCPNPEEEDNGRKICGKRLPLKFFNADATTIAIVGGTGVGKTYYFLALIYELVFKKSLKRFGIQGDVLGGRKENTLLYQFLDDIYKGRKLQSTVGMKEAINVVLDIVITSNNKTRTIYLSFFDNPGEKFSDEEYMIRNFTNVFKADGLIFLVEPKQISSFQEIIFENYEYERLRQSTEFYTVVNNTINLLNYIRTNTNSNNLFPESSWDRYVQSIKKISTTFSNKHPIPIAFTISKYDQLANYLHVDIPLDETEMEDLIMKNRKIDIEALNAISNELKDLILNEENGEIGVENLLKSNLKSHAYFGAKSISVDSEGAPERLDPKGVSLPLLWLLIKLKKIL